MGRARETPASSFDSPPGLTVWSSDRDEIPPDQEYPRPAPCRIDGTSLARWTVCPDPSDRRTRHSSECRTRDRRVAAEVRRERSRCNASRLRRLTPQPQRPERPGAGFLRCPSILGAAPPCKPQIFTDDKQTRGHEQDVEA